MEAVRIVNRARTAGRNVAEFVGQGDLLTGGDSISANGKDFLALMFQNVENWTKPAGRDRIARALTFYVEEALKTSSGADLLGQTTSPADILKKARDKQYGQDAESGDLFAGNRPEPSVPAPGAGGTGRQPEAATPEPGPQGEPASGATEADLTDYPDADRDRWDGMSEADRDALLLQVEPGSSRRVRARYAGTSWDGLSDTLRDRLMVQMDAAPAPDARPVAASPEPSPTNTELDATAEAAEAPVAVDTGGEPDGSAFEAVGFAQGKGEAADSWFRLQTEGGGVASYKARSVGQGRWRLIPTAPSRDLLGIPKAFEL